MFNPLLPGEQQQQPQQLTDEMLDCQQELADKKAKLQQLTSKLGGMGATDSTAEELAEGVTGKQRQKKHELLQDTRVRVADLNKEIAVLNQQIDGLQVKISAREFQNPEARMDALRTALSPGTPIYNDYDSDDDDYDSDDDDYDSDDDDYDYDKFSCLCFRC